jgi:protein phosphatase
VPFRLTAASVTHAGPRPTNEDSAYADADAGLFVVADGMGGHNAGEVASSLAVRVIAEAMARGADDGGPSTLATAVHDANERIVSASAERTDHAGMGTTVTALWVRRDAAVLVNVGDSRSYVWRAGRLSQMTRDDSWVQKLEDEGTVLSAAELKRHPMRHVLTEVVGVRAGLEPVATQHPVEAGDVWLLSSDGLHGILTPGELASVLGSGEAVDAIAHRLVARAVAGGATDNVTAIVVRAE